mgnify:CR=1 FL=1
MNTKLPQPTARWTDAYQRSLNAILERALAMINPYRQLPPGGTTGQVLAKKSDRDYDVEWVTP